MRTSFITLVVAALSAVNAQPVKRDGGVDDATVLNFALTLEHLENAFYREALAKYDEKAFEKAGFHSWVRDRFAQVGAHEAAHVQFLSSALGSQATQPCNYSFPHHDPKSFAALSQILEGVGVSAYTGAAQFISNKDYLTAAASVLATEARHASWVASTVNGGSGWSGALDIPLTLNTVYTLAASFITSCPSTNPALPVKAFPAVSFGDKPTPGSTATVTFTSTVEASTPLYAVFFTGLSQIVSPIQNGKAVIPSGLLGTVYAVVSTNDTIANDGNIIAGPAILDFPFNAQGQLITY
ncbi:hypothetical protein H0H81_009960 [Sphagnurus paluster]|uniref:Uncharacterized protein n=1 Tax=Sphagnurus paluster TaxID=117069 RepID=A0A9P7FVI8_9AGAR|nr:hypothetical protein H0H81_009960 [Sphagnurus paluster]